MQKNKKAGFTLIELMTVIAIMGILSAIAYASYSSAMTKAKRSEGKSALMKLMQQEEGFYTQNNSYIVFSQASSDANEKKFNWFSGDSATKSAYEIKATACAGEKIQNCVLLTATPGTANVDGKFKDNVCGNLTITSSGVKGFTGTNGTKEECW